VKPLLIRQIILTATLAASLMEGAMDACLPSMDVDGTLFLVNRQTRIASEYVPVTVKTETSGGRSMRADAAQALQEMFAAAKQEAKITLTTVSLIGALASKACCIPTRSTPPQRGKGAKVCGAPRRQRASVGPGHGPRFHKERRPIEQLFRQIKGRPSG
jgi:hypothetical protein